MTKQDTAHTSVHSINFTKNTQDVSVHQSGIFRLNDLKELRKVLTDFQVGLVISYVDAYKFNRDLNIKQDTLSRGLGDGYSLVIVSDTVHIYGNHMNGCILTICI